MATNCLIRLFKQWRRAARGGRGGGREPIATVLKQFAQLACETFFTSLLKARAAFALTSFSLFSLIFFI